MEPASKIISHCGGVAAVAAWLGIDRSWVLRWTHSRERGGTGGLVPSRHQAPLLDRARVEGKEFSPAMFFDTSPAEEQAA